MEKKALRFLRCSIIIIILLCIAVFIGMTASMLRHNDKAMDDINEIYMSEMSHQLENRYNTILNLYLSRVEGLIERTSPDSFTEYSEKMVNELTIGGQVRNFTYLALYSPEGGSEVIYGESIQMINENPLQKALANHEKKLISGITTSGKVLALFGINASYPMQNGKKSTALIAGMPIEVINSDLGLDNEKTLVYAHVFRKDGSYVLNPGEDHMDNYFTYLETVPDFGDKTPQQAIDEIRDAVANDKEFSIYAHVHGQRRNIYFVPLKNSEWYLATVMMYGSLDNAVKDLGHSHLTDALVACALILFFLALLFAVYFRISYEQLKELRHEKKRADNANMAKSEFLSNMSHDIRTPMNAIVGMTAIAASNIDNVKVVKDSLRKITLSSKHLLGLINDILDMSKIETGKLSITSEQVSLRDFMDNIVSIAQPLIKEKNMKFDIFIKNILCENIYSDNTRLNQVLINLLSNALKYTPENGEISVTLSQEESPKGENYVRTHFHVRDNGIGMSEEFQQTIYDAFIRADNKRVNKVEGSGLGMAITKYIVDAMDGTIELQSEINQGTEFHIILDFEKATVSEDEMVLPDMDILLVDDDEELCRDTIPLLQEIGLQAEYATDGATAVEMAKKRYDEQKDYQIVLLDYKMPDMNGIETARQIRKHLGQKVPILLISAYDWSDVETEAQEVGISGFISKPLFKSTLYHGLEPFANPKEDKQESANEPQYDFHGKRLLVAEDFDMNWEICKALLSVHGFELDWAENGQICVDLFNDSEPGYYDAILMDLRMPVMNGYQATEAIRASERTDANIPIIAMTADAFSEDVQHCLDCGMNTHVAKPIDIPKLLRILQEYLR